MFVRALAMDIVTAQARHRGLPKHRHVACVDENVSVDRGQRPDVGVGKVDLEITKQVVSRDECVRVG